MALTSMKRNWPLDSAPICMGVRAATWLASKAAMLAPPSTAICSVPKAPTWFDFKLATLAVLRALICPVVNPTICLAVSAAICKVSNPSSLAVPRERN